MEDKELNTGLDSLIKGKSPEELLGETGYLSELTKRLVERALEGELIAVGNTASADA